MLGLTNASGIASGVFHSAARRTDGTARAWGYGAYGALGNGSEANTSQPVVVSALGDVGALAVNSFGYHGLVRKNTGEVWAWGYNGYGQLGDGTAVNRSVPVAVGGLGAVAAVAAGHGHNLAVKADGTVWSWGRNSWGGALGDGSTTDRWTPATVTGLSDVAGVPTVSFAISGTGNPAPTYRWQRKSAGQTAFTDLANNSTYAGVTTASLTITGPTAAMNGDQFQCILSNVAGTVTSAVATLGNSYPPAIVAQPTAQSVFTGVPVSFNVTASGSAPQTYQWRKNGTAIPGATAATYTLASAQLADAGAYSVVVTNGIGSATSAAVALTVTTPPPIRLALQYWQTGDHPDYEYGHDETYWVDGHYESEWVYDADNDTWNYVDYWVDGHEDTTWVVDGTYADGQYGSRWDTTVGTFGHPATTDAGAFNPAATNRGYWLNSYPANSSIVFRTWGLAPAGNCNAYQATVFSPSGAIISTGTFTSGSSWLFDFYAPTAGAYRVEVSYLNAVAATPASGTVTYFIPVAVALPAKPVITSPLTAAGFSQTAFPAYTVTASNSPFAFGATGLPAGLSINPSTGAIAGTPTVSGMFSVAITATNAGGVSIPATLVLSITNGTPAITAQPASKTMVAGQAVAFTVQATGAAPLTYQWSKNGIALISGGNILGAATETLAFNSVQAADAGNYSVAISNNAGSVVSNAATLAVVPIGTGATHMVVSGGGIAGGTVTISSTTYFTGAAEALGWVVQMPEGWAYVSSGGSVGEIAPALGATGVLEWAWTKTPSGPLTFTYTLSIPSGSTGSGFLQATAILRQNGAAVSMTASPDPLVIGNAVLAEPLLAALPPAPLAQSSSAQILPSSLFIVHSADINRNGRIDLVELTRVIELFNVRAGTARTGAYRIHLGSEDGFAPDPARGLLTASLSVYHSADPDRNARISLFELTRVIQLYNQRQATTRTGQYHRLIGTEDGFEAGPPLTAPIIQLLEPVGAVAL